MHHRSEQWMRPQFVEPRRCYYDWLIDYRAEEPYMNGKTVVVLAGYDKEIHAMMTANPGLKSRFKQYFDFPGKSGRTDGTHTLCGSPCRGGRRGSESGELEVFDK